MAGNRRSLQLRRADGGASLRPEPPENIYDSMLRSDSAYLPSELNALQTFLFVEDLSHDTVRVSFNPAAVPEDPSFGAPTEVVLIKSTAGIPLTALDGVRLRRVDLSDLEQFNEGYVFTLDTPLVGGQWYYYALFAKYEDSGNIYWLRVGKASWLAPVDYGYGEWVWRQIPEYYRRLDANAPVGDDLLHRFATFLGRELDIARTWAFTIGDLWDVGRISASLLPSVGGALGLTAEEAAGDKRMRTLTANLMALRKMKGTKDGIEGYLTALSGYRTVAYEGLNLFLDVQHTEFSQGWTAAQIPSVGVLPGWFSPTAGYTVIQTSSALATPFAPGNGVPYLALSNVSAGASLGIVAYGSSLVMQRNIPVKAGHTYKFAGSFSVSAGTPTIKATFDFYDAAGVWLNSPSGTDAAIGALSTTWQRLHSASIVAPANAAYVAVRVATTTNIGNGSLVNMWHPLLVDLSWRPLGQAFRSADVPLSDAVIASTDYTSEDYYEPPRRVYINSYPQRVNFALNSAFSIVPGVGTPLEEAWTITDSPTYGQLPFAFTDYTDIETTEDDYTDLMTDLDPLVGAGSISYSGGLMHLNIGSAPYNAAVRSGFFPVLTSGGMSAAVEARALLPDTTLRLRMRWFTDNDIATEIEGSSVVSAVHALPSASVAESGFATFPGQSGDYLSVPHFAALASVTYMSIVVRYRVPDTTPAVPASLVGKWRVTGGAQRSWVVRLNANGTFHLSWSATGGAPVIGINTPVGIDTFPPGAWITSAIFIDDNGTAGASTRIRAIHSLDEGQTWTAPVGTTTASPFTPFNATGASLTIGADDEGLANFFTGDISMVSIRSGNNLTTDPEATGPEVFRYDGRLITDDAAATFPSATGQTITAHRSGSPALTLTESSPTPLRRFDLSGAYPPAAATYGRLSLEVQGPGAQVVDFDNALIEDKPQPGQYFDGTFTDGDLGDFFFANGAPNYEAPSVYYMAFRSFLSNPGGSDRVGGVMEDLLPNGMSHSVLTAVNGLVSSPA